MSTPEPRRFYIERCLGRGGFGEVYLARMVREDFETEVAVKVLRADLDPRAQAVNRLKDEARMLGLLRHRAIPRVYDFVTLRGRLALVVEYIEGADLDTCLGLPDPLSTRGALEVLAETADALHAGWVTPSRDGGTLQLVHRDLKPSNLRIGRDGSARLLDFGIAWTEAMDRVAGTRTGAMIGSPAYMAPERYSGGKPHPSSDVYSLGCVLFEVVMGLRLFDDVSLRSMAGLALYADRFRPAMKARLADLPRDADPALTDLLRRMVEFDPTARPPIERLAAELRQVADALPGPTLAAWCRDARWPEPRDLDAPFVGDVLIEGSAASNRRARPQSDTVDMPNDTKEDTIVPEWRAPVTPAALPESDDVPRRLTLPTSDRVPPDETRTEVALPPPPATAASPVVRYALIAAAFLLATGLAWWQSAPTPTASLPAPSPTPPLAAVQAPAPSPTPSPEPTPQPTATPALTVTPTPTPPRRPTATAAPPRAASVAAPAPTGPTVVITASPEAVQLGASLVSEDAVAYPLPGPVPPGRYALSVAFDGANRQRALDVRVEAGQPLRVHCDRKLKSCTTRAP